VNKNIAIFVLVVVIAFFFLAFYSDQTKLFRSPGQQRGSADVENEDGEEPPGYWKCLGYSDLIECTTNGCYWVDNKNICVNPEYKATECWWILDIDQCNSVPDCFWDNYCMNLVIGE